MSIIHLYCLNYYQEINSYLRGNIPYRELSDGSFKRVNIDEIKNTVKKLNNSFSKLKRLSNIPVLFRGVNSKYVNHLKIGDSFQDLAYMSVSPNINVAKSFSNNHILIFKHKENSPNIKDIQKYNFLNEEEFLVKPNTTYTVTNIKENHIYLLEN